MSLEKAKKYLEEKGYADHVIELEESSATVQLAAEALGVEQGMIAKTMSFLVDGEPILILTEGTAKVDNRKYKDQFHVKAKMIPFDEVEEYITQIAFSGATEFLNKYKDKTTEDDMIGHFGLGFYSAFMVADEVHIDTLSYKEGAKPVHWVSNGGTEYEMEEGSKQEVGSTMTLYLNEDSLEFANEYRMREVLEKYCSFMPVEIFLSKENAEQEYETIDAADVLEDDVVVEHIHEDAKTEEKENENGEKEVVEVSPAKDQVKINKRPVSLSDTQPLWMKHPNECTEEEYKEFYRKVFMDYKEPFFWIHLNMDYPFYLKGILYFPKINT